MSSAAASTVAGNSHEPSAYFIDYLFRAEPMTEGSESAVLIDPTDPSATPMPSRRASARGAALNAEVARIFVNAAGAAALPAEDLRYLASVLSKRLGISQEIAKQRVAATYTRLQTQLRETEVKAKEAADKARKAAAAAAIWMFISLLSGAFVASLCATFGGRQRNV